MGKKKSLLKAAVPLKEHRYAGYNLVGESIQPWTVSNKDHKASVCLGMFFSSKVTMPLLQTAQTP